MITQERLKKLFHYDPSTGFFTRLISMGTASKGSISNRRDRYGYISIQIDYKDYLAHRLAFLYMTGKFPEIDIDHKDSIKHHNWWDNLREATESQNQQNLKKARVDNKSTGLLGSSFYKGKYVSKIMLNGKSKHLGYFNTAIEAHERYVEEKRKIHEFNTL
jgi:hypothetical protein